MNDTERLLSVFSQMYFYKELVQDDLCFTPKGETERELADLLINLGDLIIAFQLKARNDLEQTTDQEIELKWLNNKWKAAKKQIKETIGYILARQLPEFLNLRGKRIYVNSNAKIIPLVIFMNSTVKEYPHILEKHSETGMCVNCISFPEFQALCRILITPIEIASYLEYRQRFYEENRQVDLSIYIDKQDDVILTRPMKEESLAFQFLAIEYNVQKVSEKESYLTEFQAFLHEMPEHTVTESDQNANYSILLFLAHFSRVEIKAFLERIHLARKSSRRNQYGIVGSTRRADDEYVIFYVAAKKGHKLSMEYLLKLAQQKSDVKKLLQVVVYWENYKKFRIDYFLWDRNQKTT